MQRMPNECQTKPRFLVHHIKAAALPPTMKLSSLRLDLDALPTPEVEEGKPEARPYTPIGEILRSITGEPSKGGRPQSTASGVRAIAASPRGYIASARSLLIERVCAT